MQRLPGGDACLRCGERATVVFASWWRRFSAWVLDTCLVWIIAFGTWLGGQAIHAQQSSRTYAEVLGIPGEGGGFAAQLFLTIGAGTLFAWFWHAAWISSPLHGTPGQRACGFRVVRLETYQPVGFGRAFTRDIVKFASLIVANGIALMADAVLVAVLDRNQTVHDLALGTVCVHQFHPAAANEV